ncbi:MAG: CsiV family protein [Gammaproteobacteria bacterium]|nr:CsiV family protein [Gammaproteobacteria bacterium]
MSENHGQRIWRPIALLASVLALNAMVALAEESDTAEAPPRFAVEILVFENLDQSRNTPEIPPPPPLYADAEPEPDPPAAQPRAIRSGRDSKIGFLLLDPHPELPDFLVLPPTEFSLDQARERLDRLDAYRPLLHAGWTQQARRRSDARPAILGVDTMRSVGLTGEIRLYKERYLHLVVDLELADQSSYLAISDMANLLPETEADRPLARIRESRRLRGELTQYFDHPRFGLLASVRRLEEPEEATTDAEPGPN